MAKPESDPTQRFSSRVENYVRFRPGYPREVLQLLAEETRFTSAAVVADIGSGTGISTKLFLDHGNVVYAVEPNGPMRAAAETMLAAEPRFHSFAATAEATNLQDASVDYVVAGQAFHWFDVERTRREFQRILRPPGWTVLMWNTRKLDSTPFLRSYEALLQEFGTDYREVNHANVDAQTLHHFFGREARHFRKIPNEQVFDLAELTGRLLSSSYVPAADDPRYAPMLVALEALFAAHQQQGVVRFEYDTELYFGHLA